MNMCLLVRNSTEQTIAMRHQFSLEYDVVLRSKKF